MATRYDAIIAGGGLAGTCAALWLSTALRVVLVCGREAGASHIASGIVNPFAGQRLRPVWRANTALADLETTIDLAAASQYYTRPGVLRPAVSPAQSELFSSAATRSCTWMTSREASERYPDIQTDYGILHTPGGMVDTTNFLLSAQQTMEKRGCSVLRNEDITEWTTNSTGASVTLRSKRRLSAPVVILALGYGYRQFEAFSRLDLSCVMGQTVRVERPPGLKLALPVCGQGYVAPGKDTLTLGSTYERDFLDVTPTKNGTRTIGELTSSMIPQLANARVLCAAAGVRVNVPGTRLPMVGPVGHRVWIFTGLGSKGLLFAPHIARQLYAWLKDPHQIPPEIRVRTR